MRKKIINSFKFLLFLFIGIALLYFAFKDISLQDLWFDLKHANYNWVILALCLSILSHLSRAMRWKILIEPLGYTPKTRNVFYAVMIGYLANLAAPRLGEISRCGSLNKTDKIPFDSLIGTVIVERAIDLLTLIILTIIIFFSKINFFGNFIVQNVYLPLSGKFQNMFSSSIRILFLIGIISIFLVVIWYFREAISRMRVFQKLKKFGLGVFDGIKSVYKMKRFSAFIFQTFFMWFMYFLMTWVMVFALPETSSLTAIDGLFLLVIGSFGMAAPVQGGIGAFHWIISRGLTIYGIPFEKGLAFATILHESQLLMVLILGSISLIIVVLNRKKSYLA
ncbi:MAG: lysylphosphatidylglycerol synthase transmembrane domain-containing protein [Bacteroidota bacterium]|nr:lysylphosphatidylglycerol synthase transmembrane domain-containing protein [Bacteroidota bacterium]